MDLRDDIENFYEDVKEKLNEHNLGFIHERARRVLDDSPSVEDIKGYFERVINDLNQLHEGVEDVADTVEDLIGFDMSFDSFDLMETPGELYDDFQQRYQELFGEEVEPEETPETPGGGLEDIMGGLQDIRDRFEDAVENSPFQDDEGDETTESSETAGSSDEMDDITLPSPFVLAGVVGVGLLAYYIWQAQNE